MPPFFLDSSALSKRYNNELGSAWVLHLTDPASGNVLYVARITGVEVTAAITRRGRLQGVLTAAATAALDQLQSDFVSEFNLVEISPGLLNDAMLQARTHALRGYDAVQLAAALAINAQRIQAGLPPVTLLSADAELNAAALAEGLAVDDPNTHP